MDAARLTRFDERARAAMDFDDFYRTHLRRAVALAYALSGDRAIAEDVAHDAFTIAWNKWEQISRHANQSAWLARVIANRCTSRWRRLRREASAIGRLSARAEPTMSAVEVASDDFWKVVRRLPTRQAVATALFYVEDLPVEAIATILGCTSSTAKVHLFKARQRIARDLGTDPEEADG